MKKNIYIASGLFVLVVALSAGLFVPYQSTVMRCSSDDGKSFTVTSRLDEYLLNSPKFYNRKSGEWKPGNRQGGEHFVVTEVRDRSAFQTTYWTILYLTDEQLNTLGLNEGDEALKAITSITDFEGRLRRHTGEYITTKDFKKRTDTLPESIFSTLPCRIDQS